MRIKTNCALDMGPGASSAWYLTKAFYELGHEIVTGYEADLVINIDGMPRIDPLPNTTYMLWDCDSFFRDPEGIDQYDQIFIGGCPEDLPKYPKGTIFLPHAFDPSIHYRRNVPYNFDLVMIGNKNDQLYHDRNMLVELLRGKHNVYHEEVPFGDEYATAMSMGTLIFNKSLGEKNIPIRFFEGLAIGCLVQNYNDNLDALATAHEHYIPYTNNENLMQQVEDYLSRPEKIVAMRQASTIHALEHHTYQHRAKSILEYV